MARGFGSYSKQVSLLPALQAHPIHLDFTSGTVSTSQHAWISHVPRESDLKSLFLCSKRFIPRVTFPDPGQANTNMEYSQGLPSTVWYCLLRKYVWVFIDYLIDWQKRQNEVAR